MSVRERAQGAEQPLEVSLVQFVAALLRPGCGEVGTGSVDGLGNVVQVFVGVEDIDDLGGVGEVFFGEVPDPRCAVAEDDLSLGPIEAAPACLAHGAAGHRGGLGVGVVAGGGFDGGADAEGVRGAPSVWVWALHTATSLASRVLADPSGCLPLRPWVSLLRTGTPVPSRPR